MFTDKMFDVLEGLEGFSGERGHTVLDLAFAWLLANPAISSVIAGATKVEQVISNSKAAGWHLSADEIGQIDTLLAA